MRRHPIRHLMFSGMFACCALPLFAQASPFATDAGFTQDPKQPAAVTKTIWWGYSSCPGGAPGSTGLFNCDAETGLSTSGAATTIAIGDSVKFDTGTTTNHDIWSGSTTGNSGLCNAYPSGGGSLIDPTFLAWVKTPTAKFSDYSAGGAGPAFVFRFNKPGVYWMYCSPHKNTQITRVVVTPITTVCKVGADTTPCQNPLLGVAKIQIGQTLAQVTGLVTQTQGLTTSAYIPVSPAAATVLFWSGSSTTKIGVGGAVRIFRSTKPDFSQNLYEPTTSTRMSCAPDWLDLTTPPVIVGQPQIYYYKVCDNGGGPTCPND